MTIKVTITDKAINTTYQNVTGLTGGGGVDAVFDVTKTNGTYTAVLDSATASAGTGYAPGDTITIAGSKLGGTNSVNDLIVTVATVGAGGKIATFGSVGSGRVGDGVIDVSIDATGTSSKTDAFVLGGKLNEFDVAVSTKGVVTVTHPNATNTTLTLTDYERLILDDKALAFDVKGAAGEVYALLACAIGKADVTPAMVGKCLYLADNGKSDVEIAAAILASDEYKTDAQGTGNETFVKQVYKNVLNQVPTLADLEYWTGLLDSKTYTQAQLLEAASNLEVFRDATHVNLVGMTSIEYVPFGI